MADQALRAPDEQHRWRCAGCGNLTRFDVVRTATTKEYWHFDLSGQPNVEDSETFKSVLSSVTCRWCGRTDAVELVLRPDAPGSGSATASPDSGVQADSGGEVGARDR
ncbi:MAG: hypothetical protein ACRDPG_10190 [Nocardioidaceae bacterium]